MVVTPAISLNFVKWVAKSPLVIISATISSVLQYWIFRFPFWTSSRMKWYLMAICVLLLWNWGFLVKHIATWLSSYTVAGLAVSFCSSAMSLFNQMASCAAEVRETYSASAVDSATHYCFLLLQLIEAPDSLKRYLEVDFLSVMSPPQSASEYPMKLNDSSFMNNKP